MVLLAGGMIIYGNEKCPLSMHTIEKGVAIVVTPLVLPHFQNCHFSTWGDHK